ncbi:uncharacterized protein [Drosophila takahashii]|uniref:uncharacterized protein n=1 Tax=Drosophila takahashii TaxID=29030 RepID=UPI0038990A5B
MSNSGAFYYVRRDPKLLSTCILLRNLPNCKEKHLKRFCRTVGKVLRLGIWRTYAVAQYETARKAQVAALILNGSTFKSQILTVTCSTTNFDPPMEKPYQNSTKEKPDFQLKKSPSSSRSSSLAKGHPDRMQKLLEILTRNLPLTESQYEEIITYLEAEKKEQWKSKEPAIMYPTFEAAKRDVDLMKLVQDQRVQDALGSIYNSDVKDEIAEYL